MSKSMVFWFIVISFFWFLFFFWLWGLLFLCSFLVVCWFILRRSLVMWSCRLVCLLCLMVLWLFLWRCFLYISWGSVFVFWVLLSWVICLLVWVFLYWRVFFGYLFLWLFLWCLLLLVKCLVCFLLVFLLLRWYCVVVVVSIWGFRVLVGLFCLLWCLVWVCSGYIILVFSFYGIWLVGLLLLLFWVFFW